MTQHDELGDAGLAPYLETMRARDARNEALLSARRERAWLVARSAADVLRALGAQRVCVFGSLAHGRWFTATSDIDLAAWGMGPDEHLIAIARIEDIAADFRVDVVRVEQVTEALRRSIESTGIDL